MSYDLRKFYNKHNHSDSLDAKALAQIPVVNQEALEELSLPGKDTFALDRRNRKHKKLTQQIASIKTQIRDFYTWLQPGLVKVFSDPYGTRARALCSLLNCLRPFFLLFLFAFLKRSATTPSARWCSLIAQKTYKPFQRFLK